MGIYDRDYYRNSLPRGGFGYFDAWSVTTWLIAINVAVFFVDAAMLRATRPRPRDLADVDDDTEMVQAPARDRTAMMFDGMGPVQRWGYFSAAKAIRGGQVWRVISFQFLH